MSDGKLNLAETTAKAGLGFDLLNCQQNYPVLQQHVYAQKPLVYLDNAASTQQSAVTLDTVAHYTRTSHANIHRGVHALSQRATTAYEASRDTVAAFIHAARREEIVFCSGATAALNIIARSFGPQALQAGDEVLLSSMEHHANIVPWQMLAEQTGANIRVIPLLETGDLDLVAYQQLLSKRTKIVALTHVSNVLGTVNPIAAMIAQAHQVGAKVVIDGVQATARIAVDVQALDCDFYVFSGHKMYAPTGIGVLYAKHQHLTAMPPLFGGGDMIHTVSFSKSTYADPPYKFEAGTPPIAAAIGLAAAIVEIQKLGLDAIWQHEQDLLAYANKVLVQLPALRLLAQPKVQAGVISFLLGDIHPHDVGTILDQAGVAVRVGHHCAMPLMQVLNCAATVRASFAVYNRRSDIDALLQGLQQVCDLFGSHEALEPLETLERAR